jgi:hypothetical protein
VSTNFHELPDPSPEPEQPGVERPATPNTATLPPADNGTPRPQAGKKAKGNEPMGSPEIVGDKQQDATQVPSSGDGQTPPTSAPASDRVTYEEMEAAIGAPADGVIIGQAEIRYECRSPKGSGEYFRTHPDRGLWQDTTLLMDVDGMDKAAYLVVPAMQPPLAKWLKRVLLVPCVNQDGVFFIWPIVVADIALGQRSNRSETTKRNAAQRATDTWINLVWHRGQHHAVPATGNLGEPAWPEGLDLRMINMRTFADHFIRDRDHDIAKVYLGLAGRR